MYIFQSLKKIYDFCELFVETWFSFIFIILLYVEMPQQSTVQCVQCTLCLLCRIMI